jgi:hypothetical protein
VPSTATLPWQHLVVLQILGQAQQTPADITTATLALLSAAVVAAASQQ